MGLDADRRAWILLHSLSLLRVQGTGLVCGLSGSGPTWAKTTGVGSFSERVGVGVEAGTKALLCDFPYKAWVDFKGLRLGC